MENKSSLTEKEKKSVEKEVERESKKAEKYAKKGDYSNAASAYQKASRLAESIRDKRAVDFCMDEANCRLKLGNDFNVGWAYKCAAIYSMTFSDFSNAINFATKAIEYFSRSNFMYAVQWCYNIMGEAYEKTGNYDIAIKNYQKSINIEYSEDIDQKIKNLSKSITKLVVEQECSKPAVKEGEKADVVLKVTNSSKNEISEIKILGEKSNEMESFSLKPGETRNFSYKMAAHENAVPLFRKISWRDSKGVNREMEIEPPRICLVPNVKINHYIKGRLEIGKQSYFVISITNNSKNPIENVKLEISFPPELKVRPVTGYEIDRIETREEKSFVFRILPDTVGKTLLKHKISFRDVRGMRYRKNIKNFILEESLASDDKR